MRTIQTTLLLLLWAISVTAFAQKKGGDELSGPYNVVANWPTDLCGPDWQIGSTGGVWAAEIRRPVGHYVIGPALFILMRPQQFPKNRP